LPRAAVAVSKNLMEIHEIEKPEIGPKDMLMRIKLCGICGSDVHLFHGEFPIPFPLTLGHEIIGEVAEVGEEASEHHGVEEGDMIVAEMLIPCHRCYWCQKGLYNLCLMDAKEGRQYGCNIPLERPPHLWGGYADYLYVPYDAIVHKYEKRVAWKEAVLTEPLAVSVRGVHRAGVKIGDSVVISGPGTIGLLATVSARESGAYPIILIGTREERLRLGEKLGADYTIDIRKGLDPIKEVYALTSGCGADISLECAGTPTAQVQALRTTRKGGKCVVIGLTGSKEALINADRDICMSEKLVIGSYLSAWAYEPAINIIQEQKYPLSEIVTHQFPVEQARKAIETSENRHENAIKVILKP